MRRTFFASVAGWLLLAVCGTAFAQDYPSHPTRFVVGTGVDQLARIVADRLSTQWGQPVFVEQKAGAGGTVAADFVAKSAHDGYNWLLSSGALTIGSVLQPQLPYNFSRDLVPVGLIGTLPFVLVVNNELPVKTLAELVAYAKAHPGALNYASGGTGAGGHLAGEMLKQMAGFSSVHIPYKAVAPALADVVAGQAQWTFSPAPTALPLLKAGKVRALAVSSNVRYARLPDVPTVAESGYPAYELEGWVGIHVAARTPQAIIDRISEGVAQAMANPEVAARAESAGYVPSRMGRAEFDAFVRADVARLTAVVREAHIRFE